VDEHKRPDKIVEAAYKYICAADKDSDALRKENESLRVDRNALKSDCTGHLQQLEEQKVGFARQLQHMRDKDVERFRNLRMMDLRVERLTAQIEELEKEKEEKFWEEMEEREVLKEDRSVYID
jgi:hypothetical protein